MSTNACCAAVYGIELYPVEAGVNAGYDCSIRSLCHRVASAWSWRDRGPRLTLSRPDDLASRLKSSRPGPAISTALTLTAGSIFQELKRLH
jgi:hypothetical protein